MLNRRVRWGRLSPVLQSFFLSRAAGVPALALVLLTAATSLSAQVNPADVEGRQIVLVTGSTDGLGREVALRLGASGAHVIVHGRNIERGLAVVQEIESSGGTARFIQADLASLAQVRELAEIVTRDYDRLNLLVNNAGIGRGLDGAPREVSADGHELRFAVNYLSHFLLTRTLLPLLRAGAPSRIVSVSSAAQTPIDFDDVMLERAPYAGERAYAQSKLAQIFMTFDLAEELQGTGITANALHPETYMDTSMVRERGGTAFATIDEGADAVMNVITSPDAGSGQYFNILEVGRANSQAYDSEARARLRELSLELTGLD
jgi:NAD(P)-dependent dehydrogenase (short-subunit alcohol dehydrogenase family)